MTDDHWPIADIASRLVPPCSPGHLQNLARKPEANGFPDPVKTLGRFKFYDLTEMQEWWSYYSRAIARMKRGEHLAPQ